MERTVSDTVRPVRQSSFVDLGGDIDVASAQAIDRTSAGPLVDVSAVPGPARVIERSGLSHLLLAKPDMR
jgi:hypothetical protein